MTIICLEALDPARLPAGAKNDMTPSDAQTQMILDHAKSGLTIKRL